MLSCLGSDGNVKDLAFATLGKRWNAWQEVSANCRRDSAGGSREEDGASILDDDNVVSLFQQVGSMLTG